MSEEEKFVMKMLKDSQNTYIEDTKVEKVLLTTVEVKILLNLIDKQQKEIKELNLENQAFYEEMNCNDNEYISKKYLQLKEKNKKLQKEIEELKEEINQTNKDKWEDWLEENE